MGMGATEKKTGAIRLIKAAVSTAEQEREIKGDVKRQKIKT